MYARYREYHWKVEVDDAEGWGDVTLVEVRLKSGTTLLAGVGWSNSSGFYELSTNADWITLSSGTRTQVDADTVSFQFNVWIEWSFADTDGANLEVYVEDSNGLSASTTKSGYCDIDTDLKVLNFAVSDSRADVGTTVTFSGEVYYEDTNTILVPSTQIDYVQIMLGDTAVGTAQDTNDFSIGVTLPATVGKYTYHPRVVTASGKTFDLTGTTVAVIADKLTVTLSAADCRVDVGATVTITWEITRQYDDSVVTDFSITITKDGAALGTYTTGSVDQTEGSVAAHTYSCGAVTDNTYGLTAFDTNAITVIWDRLLVTNWHVSDTHVNVSDTVTVWVEIVYDYDDEVFDSADGVVYIGGVQATWDSANSRWCATFTRTEVAVLDCGIPSSFTDNKYGLTAIANATTQTIVWDRVVIVYFEQAPAATYVSTGTVVTFSGYVYYEALNEPIGAQAGAVRVTVDGGAQVLYLDTDADGRFEWSTSYTEEGRHTFRFDPADSPDGVTAAGNYYAASVEWSEVRTVGMQRTWQGEDWTTGFIVTFEFIVTFSNYTVLTNGTVYLYTNVTGEMQKVAEAAVRSDGYVNIRTFILERVDYLHVLFNFSAPQIIDDNIYEEVVYVPGELLYFDPYPSWDVPDPERPNEIRIIAGTNRRDCTFFVYVGGALVGSYSESLMRSGVTITFEEPGHYDVRVDAEDGIGTISATVTVHVRAVPGEIVLAVHDRQGRSPIEAIRIYVNGTEAYGELLEPGHRVRLTGYGANPIYTHCAYNITITHWVFGKALWSGVVTFPEGSTVVEVDVLVDVYSWKFQNQGETPVWVAVERDGARWSRWVYPWEVVEFWLFPGTYTLRINYTEVSGNYFIIMNGTYSETTFTINRDYAMILSGTTLRDVFGTVSQLYDYVENVNETITRQIINLNITIRNVNSTLSQQVVNVEIRLDNVNSTLSQQILRILADVSNVNSTLFMQTVEIISHVLNLARSTAGMVLRLDGADDLAWTYRPDFADAFTAELEFMPLNTSGTHYLLAVGEQIDALRFDGVDDYVEVPHDPSLKPPSKVTIEVVAKLYDLSGRPAFVSCWPLDPDEDQIYLFRVYDGNLQFYIKQSDLTEVGGTFATLETNKWYHLCAIADGSKLYCYVNGEKTPTELDYDGTLNSGSAGDVWIGRYLGWYLNADIALVRIYNRALSPEEIRWNYEHPDNPVRDGLVLWLDGGHVRGSTVYDLSGNGNHGELRNGAARVRAYFRDVWAVCVRDGTLVFRVLNGTGWAYAEASDAGAVLRNGVWYHYTASWNGTHACLYRGGTLVDAEPLPSVYEPVLPTNLTLGARPDGTAHFGGMLRLFRFYNAALPPADVLWNAMHPGEPLRDGLLIWYPPHTLGEGWWENAAGAPYEMPDPRYEDGVFYETNAPEQEGGSPWSENFADAAGWSCGPVQALRFDGEDDYVGVRKSLNDLGASSAYTFEVLFKPVVFATGDDQCIIASAYRVHSIHLHASMNAIDFNVYFDAVYRVALVILPATHVWYHAVLTAESYVGAKAYLNGQLKGEISNSNPLGNTHLLIDVGRVGNTDAEYFNGYIAYIRVYRRALTPEEILWNYEHPDNPVRDGLVLWLHHTSINASAGVWEDISGCGNDGTIYGAVPVNVYWDEMRVLSFDGTDDYVDCGDDPSLSPTASVSVEALIKPAAVNVTRAIFGKFSITTNSGYLLFMMQNRIQLWWGDGNTTYKASSDPVISAGEWYHVVGIYDGQYLKVFINGEISGTPNEIGLHSLAVPSGHYSVAARSCSYDFFPGCIAYVRVYNRTLTPEEIEWNYRHPDRPYNTTGLVLWFQPVSIDEGAGVWRDLSGCGNDGTIHGARVAYALGAGYSIGSTGDELAVEATVSADTTITLSANTSVKAFQAHCPIAVNVTEHPFLEVRWGAATNASARFALAILLSDGTREAWAVVAWREGNFSAVDRVNLLAVAARLGAGFRNASRVVILAAAHPRNASLWLSLRVDWVRIYSFQNYTVRAGASPCAASALVAYSDFGGIEFEGNGTALGLRFDGTDDYVEVPHSDSLAVTHLTLEFWVRFKSVDSNYETPVRKGLHFGTETRGTGASAELYGFIRGNDGVEYWHGWGRHINYNVWEQYVMIFQPEIKKYYINGELTRSVELPGVTSILASADPLRIGCYKPGVRHADVDIALVRIYNRALSEDEILWNYLHPNEPVRGGLVLWLHHTSINATAGVWRDLSGCGNDGAIHGAEPVYAGLSIERPVYVPPGTGYVYLRGYGDANVVFFVRARFLNGTWGSLFCGELADGEWDARLLTFRHTGITAVEVGVNFTDAGRHRAALDRVEVGLIDPVEWNASLVGAAPLLAAPNIMHQTVTLMSSVLNANATLYAQTVNILSSISNANSTIYAQTVRILSEIENANATLYAQTVEILGSIRNANATLYNQTLQILADVWNTNATLYEQTVQILADICNANATLYAQTVEILANVHNAIAAAASQGLYFDGVDDRVELTKYLDYPVVTVEALVKKVGGNDFMTRAIVWEGLGVVAGQFSWGVGTRYDREIRLYLSNESTKELIVWHYDFWNKWTHVVVGFDTNTMKAFCYANGEFLGEKDITVVPVETHRGKYVGFAYRDHVFYGPIAFVRVYNRSLSESEILWNYYHPNEPVRDGLVLWLSPESVDVDEGVWRDLSGCGNDGTIHGARPATTSMFLQTISLLANVYNTNSTLYSQTVQILSDIQNTNATLYQQTLEILADVSNANATLYQQTLEIISLVENTNATLYQQTLTILSDLHNANATLYQQTVRILADIYNTNSTLYSQTVQILTDLWSVNSTLYEQTVQILTDISSANATLYQQTVQILTDLWNTNSTLYSQTVQILADISNVNSTLYHQAVTILTDLRNHNSTLYEQTVTILSSVRNTNATLYEQTVRILADLWSVNSTLYQQTVDILADVRNANSTLYSQSLRILTDLYNVNSTLYQQTVDIIAHVRNTNATLYEQTLQILADIYNTNATLYAQTVEILLDVQNANATLYNQTLEIISLVRNSNATIYQQTLRILSDLANVNATLYQQTVQILADLHNANSTLYEQTVAILADVRNTNSTLFQQTVEILADIENVNSTLYSQTLRILADVQNTNATLYAQTVELLAEIQNTNSTLYSQTVQILSNISNVNSTLYEQTVQILANIENTNSTLYRQTLQILADLQNTNATLYSQTVQILADLQNANSTLYEQTVTILANIESVNSTLFQQTVDILADVQNTNATLYQQTVTILSNIQNTNATLYSQTLQILSDLSNVNVTLYSQTVQILSDISNVNTSLYSQTLTILSEIENTNTTLYQQTVRILNDLWNANSTLYSQTVTILSDIANTNATLYGQTVTILSNIQNTNATIYQQTLRILSDISNANATLYAQTVEILSEISNVNVTLYSQTVTILSEIENTNATLYQQAIAILNDIWNANSTIYEQTVAILNRISNVNTTLYRQTVEILSAVRNTNSTIFQQTVEILNSISNTNATLYAQTLQILSDVSNVNSTLYEQTVQILSDIWNVNSTLYSQTVQILADIWNVNSTLYQQAVTIMAEICSVNSTLYEQTVEILADLRSANSTLYSQTVRILADVWNANSTIYNQTLEILADLWNVNSTLYRQAVEVVALVQNANASIHNQTANLMVALMNANSTIHRQLLNVLFVLYGVREVHLVFVTPGNETVPMDALRVYVDENPLSLPLYYTKDAEVEVTVKDVWGNVLWVGSEKLHAEESSVVVPLNVCHLVVYNPNTVKLTVSIWPVNGGRPLAGEIGPAGSADFYLPYGEYYLEARYGARVVESRVITLETPRETIKLPCVETPPEPSPVTTAGNLLIPIAIIIATGGFSWVLSITRQRAEMRRRREKILRARREEARLRIRRALERAVAEYERETFGTIEEELRRSLFGGGTRRRGRRR